MNECKQVIVSSGKNSILFWLVVYINQWFQVSFDACVCAMNTSENDQ